MTAASTTFDLIAVPPALADRRALSQAWFDALHLAQRTAPRAHRATAPPAVVERTVPWRAHARTTTIAGPLRAVLHAVPMPHARAAGIAPVRAGERRAHPQPIAVRICARLRESPHAAAFAIETPRGRVHVSVRREREGLRLVALCAPALRADVAAALAQVRFALAGRGVAIAW